MIHMMMSNRVLENDSNMAYSAGVQWSEMVPPCRGPLETAPEDAALKTRYEMLETQQTGRKAIQRIEKGTRPKAGIVRRTIKRPAQEERALWAACQFSLPPLCAK